MMLSFAASDSNFVRQRFYVANEFIANYALQNLKMLHWSGALTVVTNHNDIFSI